MSDAPGIKDMIPAYPEDMSATQKLFVRKLQPDEIPNFYILSQQERTDYINAFNVAKNAGNPPPPVPPPKATPAPAASTPAPAAATLVPGAPPPKPDAGGTPAPAAAAAPAAATLVPGAPPPPPPPPKAAALGAGSAPPVSVPGTPDPTAALGATAKAAAPPSGAPDPTAALGATAKAAALGATAPAAPPSGAPDPTAAPDYSKYRFLKHFNSLKSHYPDRSGLRDDVFSEPEFMTFVKDGNIALNDKIKGIQVFDPITMSRISEKTRKNESFDGIAFDSSNNRILVTCSSRKFMALNPPDLTIAYSVPNDDSNNPYQSSIAVNKSEIFLFNRVKGRIDVFNVNNGEYIRKIEGDATKTENWNPDLCIVFDNSDNIVMTNDKGKIYVINSATGVTMRAIGSEGTKNGQFNYPCGLAFDNAGNIIVADTGNHRVQVLRYSDGEHIATFGGKTDTWRDYGKFMKPFGVLVNNEGKIIVSDKGLGGPNREGCILMFGIDESYEFYKEILKLLAGDAYEWTPYYNDLTDSKSGIKQMATQEYNTYDEVVAACNDLLRHGVSVDQYGVTESTKEKHLSERKFRVWVKPPTEFGTTKDEYTKNITALKEKLNELKPPASGSDELQYYLTLVRNPDDYMNKTYKKHIEKDYSGYSEQMKEFMVIRLFRWRAERFIEDLHNNKDHISLLKELDDNIKRLADKENPKILEALNTKFGALVGITDSIVPQIKPGELYICEINKKYTDEGQANSTATKLKNGGFNAMVVNKGGDYYIVEVMFPVGVLPAGAASPSPVVRSAVVPSADSSAASISPVVPSAASVSPVDPSADSSPVDSSPLRFSVSSNTKSVVSSNASESFGSVLDGLLSSGGFSAKTPELNCNASNTDLLKKEPNLELLVSKFKGPKSVDKNLFAQAYYFCRNMKNSFSLLMSPNPKYSDVVTMRKNFFLLTCVDMQGKLSASGSPASKPDVSSQSPSANQSLQDTIDYYSQGGGGQDNAVFKTLNIPKEAKMDWTFGSTPSVINVSGVDERFTKGIPNEGNTCFFNAALQLLLCNEDFLQLMIEGNCQDRTKFVTSLTPKEFVVNNSDGSTEEKCKSNTTKHDTAQKIISNLLWFFNKWKKGEKFSKKEDKPDEKKDNNPIALLVDELSDMAMGNTADATEVLGKLFEKIDCVDNAFIQKFLQNLNIEVEETLTTPSIESVVETTSKQTKLVGFNPITIDAAEPVEIINNNEYNLSDLIDNTINEKNNKKIYSLNDEKISKFSDRENLINILGNLGQELTKLNNCAGAYYNLINAQTPDKDLAKQKYDSSVNDLNAKPVLNTSVLQGVNKSEYSSFFTGYDSKPTPYPDKWKYESTPDETQDKRKIPESLVETIIEKIKALNTLLGLVNFNDDEAKKKFISDNAESIKTLNMLIGDVMYVIRSPLQSNGKPYESTTSKKALKCGKYLASYINRTYKQKDGTDGKYTFKVKIESKIELSINSIKKSFTLLGFIVHYLGHYYYIKCDSNGNVAVELNDSSYQKPISIDFYYDKVTGFIYKLAEEEPVALSASSASVSPPAAVLHSEDDIQGYIREAIGDKGDDTSSESDDSGVKYRIIAGRTDDTSCKALKKRVIKLDDEFLDKAKAIAECYRAEYYFPAWVCAGASTKRIKDDYFPSAKVYYDQGDDFKQVVTLATRREPTNLNGNKEYKKNSLECMFGYRESPYSDTNHLNIAVYTKTPYYDFDGLDFNKGEMKKALRGEAIQPPTDNTDYPFMHIVHAYAPAFDNEEQPDYKRYLALSDTSDTTKEKAKQEYKKDIQKMLSKISKAYEEFKSSKKTDDEKKNARLMLTGVGQGFFSEKCSNVLGGSSSSSGSPTQEESTQECNRIFYECVCDFFGNDPSVYYSFYSHNGTRVIAKEFQESVFGSGNRILVDINYMDNGQFKILDFTRSKDNQEFKNLTNLYPSGAPVSPLGDNILWVNAWDPFSMLGNGNYSDPSTDGYFGRKTAIAVIGWPVTNPAIGFGAVDFKAILLEKYITILTPLLTAGFNTFKKDYPDVNTNYPALYTTCDDYYTQFGSYIKSALFAFEVKVDVDFSGEIPPETACEGVTDSNLKKFLKLAASVITSLSDVIAPYDKTNNQKFKQLSKKLTMLGDFLVKCSPAADSPVDTKLAGVLAAAAADAAAGPKLRDAISSDSDSSASGSSASRSVKETRSRAPAKAKAILKTPSSDDEDDDGVDNPLLSQIRKGTTLKKVSDDAPAAVGAAKKGAPPKEEEFDIMAALKKRLNARRAGVGGDEKGKGLAPAPTAAKAHDKAPDAPAYRPTIPPGMGDPSSAEESDGYSSDWGGGGHIKKKLLRKQSYRNLNSINNKTSRKKTKLTEVFKSKKNNKKTLRKR
jgi:hypothetical protein